MPLLLLLLPLLLLLVPLVPLVPLVVRLPLPPPSRPLQWPLPAVHSPLPGRWL
jgi:hypothetical protein